MNVVLDRNVIICAVISAKGPPSEIFRAWRAGSFTWLVSPELLFELELVLSYPRVKRYLAWNEDQTEQFLNLVRQLTRLVQSTTQQLDVLKEDPNENWLLNAAAAGEADYIVSADKRLLDLARNENIQIVTPARFVFILNASDF